MSIFVRSELIKSRYKLLMFDGDIPIGEYERSQEADIERKKREIEAASQLLIQMFQHHGEIVVRWDGRNRKKSIRANGVEVGEIPKEFWHKPSWQ